MTSRARLFLVLLLFSPAALAQRAINDNDASCDISVAPAATLLLPYFEVDVNSVSEDGASTMFTITNVSHLPQVARVTLWTDLAYPVFSFNIYLTGYDVQSISLYDVLVRGRIAPDDGTGSAVSPVGKLSGTSRAREYDNPLLDEEMCDALPVALDNATITRLLRAFTMGQLPAAGSSAACSVVGQPHPNAVGYATIDVVGSCNSTMPSDRSYFADDIRFDNVLIGDYIQTGSEGHAQGNTMVHIRAIPEGGHPRDRMNDPRFRVTFPRTFYGRFLHPMRKGLDARQPLPTVFAARWISEGFAGIETRFKIWREGREAGDDCRNYSKNDMEFVEAIRFDEEENPTARTWECPVTCLEPDWRLPATAFIDADCSRADMFPANPDEAAGGWMYLNLAEPAPERTAQAWITVSMRNQIRFSFDLDAAPLGNGCSAAEPESDELLNPIGPLKNVRK